MSDSSHPFENGNYIKLDPDDNLWDQFFTVAPLVVIGTREGSHYNLAPKHMAMPLGYQHYFGFVCTPKHSTYHQVQQEGYFTVSFPKPDQAVMASLAATPRCNQPDFEKPIIRALPTIKAPNLDALFLRDAYLYFECEHYKTIDGFGDCSLISGRITAAFVHKQSYKSSDLDPQDLIFQSPLLAYIAYGRFAEISNTMSFPFPRNFSK